MVPLRRLSAYLLLPTLALAAAACSDDGGDPRRLESGPVNGTAGPPPTTPPTDGAADDATASPPDTTSADPAATDPAGATDAGTTDAETTDAETSERPTFVGGFDVTAVAGDFQVPWGLVLLGDGSILVGERDTGRVWRVPTDGDPAPVLTVPGVEADGEGGLLGLAVPEDDEGTLLAYLTAAQDNRVVRLDLSAATPDGDLPAEVVVDGIPKAGNHNGGRIEFGPDGYLYISTGDASDGDLSQDPASLAGKILRVDARDGAPAPDNPDPDSPVYSMGHRNVQGLAWDEAGRLWASEFGQNSFDELNLIEAGGNYGWPQVEGAGGEPEFIDPVLTWPTSEASPSGLAYGPDGALYLAALRGESLWRVPLGEAGEVGEPERLLAGEYGRLRSVVADADGLWVLTSNTFRGSPAADDDRLLHLQF